MSALLAAAGDLDLEGGAIAVSFVGLESGLLLPMGAACLALVSLLYVLRVRRRPVVVPFIGLFHRFLSEEQASSLLSKLRRLLSWLLHLLLVLLLLFALADPRDDREVQGARHIVVLVDVSASMKSKDAGVSRMTRAREKIRQWLPGLARGDELLLVELGSRPRPLGAWSGERQALEASLQRLTARDVRADLGGGLALSRDVLRGKSGAEVIVVGDGAYQATESPLDRSTKLSFWSVAGETADAPSPGQQLSDQSPPGGGLGGAPSQVERQDELPPNVGISSLAGRRYPLDPDQSQVLLEVANTGSEDAEVELTLSRAGRGGQLGGTLEIFRLRVPARERIRKTLADLPFIEEGIVARLQRVDGGEDVLEADNLARALLPPREPRTVLIVGEPNNFLDAALLLDPSLEASRVAGSAYPPPGEFDLTIFDGAFPQRVERGGAALYLGRPPGDEDAGEVSGYPLETGTPLEMFGFDRWEQDSSLFRYLDPYDIQVLSGASLRPTEADRALGFSGQRVILAEGERDAGRFIALGFDPRESDFVLRVAFPLFVHNALLELSADPIAEETGTFRSGTELHFNVGAVEEAGLRLVDSGAEGARRAGEDSWRQLSVVDGHASHYVSDAGFYELSRDDQTSRFAVNFFDPLEAQLPPSQDLSLESEDEAVRLAEAVSGFEPQTRELPWIWLVFAVLVASFLEWWSYQRRWTL